MEVINDEYISKLEAVRILQTAYAEGRIQAKDGCVSVLDDINALPTADVQPVIHAHWIELPKALNSNENPCQCSNCKHILSFMNYYPKSKYCDNCGAKMEEGAENG